MNLTRETIVTINRCRSNHYSLAASLFRVHIVTDPKYECGYDQQDLNHILWNCSNYDLQREELMRKLKKHKHFPPFTIKSFLSTLDPKLLQIICEFFKKCGLKI